MYCKLVTIYNTPHYRCMHKHKLSAFRNMPCDVRVLFGEMYYSFMYFYSNYYRRKLLLSPLQRAYRKFYPYPCGTVVAFIPISAGIPPALSPLPQLPRSRYDRRPHPHVTLYLSSCRIRNLELGVELKVNCACVCVGVVFLEWNLSHVRRADVNQVTFTQFLSFLSLVH